MIYAKKQTQHPTMKSWHQWRVFNHETSIHMFFVANLQIVLKPWIPTMPAPPAVVTNGMAKQYAVPPVQFHQAAFSVKPMHLGNRETRFLLIRIALEWSKSTHWFLFGIIFLGVILLSGSSNAKGMFLMVNRNLAVAHNCHSIYCLGLVVCVASLSCFVLSWIWPGWSSKQSCETWGGGYCCYY